MAWLSWVIPIAVIATNVIAVVYWIIKETTRRQSVETRLSVLEAKSEEHDDNAEAMKRIERKLGTLITILREKNVVNGHPDLNG